MMECELCEKPFQDPRILPCGHSFCKHCLLKLLEQEKKIICPTCLIEHGDIKPENLVKNLSLVVQVENLPHHKLSKKSMEEQSKPCFNSSDESCEKIATLYCKICQVFMCKTCQLKEHSSVICRSHEVVSSLELLETNRSPQAMCEEHKQPITMFCKLCNHYACSTCVIFKHRDTRHELIQVEILVTKERSKIRQTLQKAELELRKLEEELQKIEHHKQELLQSIEAVEEFVTTTDPVNLMTKSKKILDNLNVLSQSIQEDREIVFQACEELATTELDKIVINPSSSSSWNLLLRAFRDFSEDYELINVALTAVSHVSFKNAEIQIKLGEEGVCKYILESMIFFSDDLDITLKALNAIWVLASNNENQARFGRHNTCEVLTKLFQKYMKNREVTYQVCAAIWNLALNDENAFIFGQNGCCELIIQTLREYENDRDVILEACASMWTLAANSENQSKFGLQGACELILKALLNYNKDSSVVYYACGAVGNLAVNPVNKEKFKKLKAKEALRKCIVTDQTSWAWNNL